jgi:glycosyltransferase involved in cell wall biosynthesis
MRIVYLSPAAGLGGAERCLLDLFTAVREAAPHAQLHLVTAAEGPLLNDAERMGVKTTLLPLNSELRELGDSSLRGVSKGAQVRFLRGGARAGIALAGYVRSLRSLLGELRPTIVHSNGIKFHLLSAAAGSAGAPLVWHVRDMIGDRPVVARALRPLATRAAAAVAISDLVAADARRVLGQLPIHVVYDGIDTGHFSPGEADGRLLDDLSGLSPAEAGVLRVGLVAAYARWKGQDVFLNAVARLVTSDVSRLVRFYIVGGPIYSTRGSQFSEGELRSMAIELRIADRVGFVPFQSDVLAVYRALDVVVHASTRPEPFGRTIAEAMACAKPLVLSETSGAAELIPRDSGALFVSQNDAVALADAVERLLLDAELRERLAVRARSVAVEKFSRRRIGAQMMDLYATYVGSSLRLHTQRFDYD